MTSGAAKTHVLRSDLKVKKCLRLLGRSWILLSCDKEHKCISMSGSICPESQVISDFMQTLIVKTELWIASQLAVCLMQVFAYLCDRVSLRQISDCCLADLLPSQSLPAWFSYGSRPVTNSRAWYLYSKGVWHLDQPAAPWANFIKGFLIRDILGKLLLMGRQLFFLSYFYNVRKEVSRLCELLRTQLECLLDSRAWTELPVCSMARAEQVREAMTGIRPESVIIWCFASLSLGFAMLRQWSHDLYQNLPVHDLLLMHIVKSHE